MKNYAGFFAAHKDPEDAYSDLFALLLLTRLEKGELGMMVQLDATKPDSRARLGAFYAAAIGSLDIDPVDFHLQVGEYAPAQPLTGNARLMPWIHATQTLNPAGTVRRLPDVDSVRTAGTPPEWRGRSCTTKTLPQAAGRQDTLGPERRLPARPVCPAAYGEIASVICATLGLVSAVPSGSSTVGTV